MVTAPGRSGSETGPEVGIEGAGHAGHAFPPCAIIIMWH